MSAEKKDAPDSETRPAAKGVPPPDDVDIVGKPMTRAELDKYLRHNAPSDAGEDCRAFALLRMAEAIDRGSIDYFGANKQHEKWLNREVDVEEQQGEPPEDLHGDDAWLIKPWLEKEVAGDQNDRFWLLAPSAPAREPVPPIGLAPGPVLVPTPAPEPTQFNQAAPTDGGTTDKPTNKPPIPRP